MNVYQINCWSIYHVQVPTFVWPMTKDTSVWSKCMWISHIAPHFDSITFTYSHISKIVSYQTLMLWKSGQARSSSFSKSSKSSAEWIILHLSIHMFGNIPQKWKVTVEAAVASPREAVGTPTEASWPATSKPFSSATCLIRSSTWDFGGFGVWYLFSVGHKPGWLEWWWQWPQS